MKKIGITTTVPVEVLFAAGYTPVDLNNVFVTSENYMELIDIAELDGFPKSMCAWIKGIYGACIKSGITEIIGVVEGDCSNTKALLEVLRMKGIKTHPFSFPHSHNPIEIKSSVESFMEYFNVNREMVESKRIALGEIRDLAKEIDRLAYEENKVTGFENHLFQVMCSDFNSDPKEFKQLLSEKIDEFSKRKPDSKKIRLGYLGVPPLSSDIYDFIETLDAKVIYNEVQREFAFPRHSDSLDIDSQYYDYTYPYDIEFRLKDIIKQIELRELDGIIHYTQAFCYRAIEDIIIKSRIAIPVLNIEIDKENKLDQRTKLRIEAFLDMLSDTKDLSR